MKGNKLRLISLLLVLVLSMTLLGGCSLPLGGNGNAESNQTEEDTNKEDMENEPKDEEEDVATESEDETVNEGEEEDDEEWFNPNLDLTTDQAKPKEELEEHIESVCTCSELCSAESINTECMVCQQDFHRCTGEPVKDPLDEFALPAGQTETVSMIAFGSNFYNTAVMNGTDKSYNYNYIYENIKETLKNYDIRIVTQETPFANNPSKYSGSAPYVSPPSIANALSEAGFNVVASATDHVFDNGREGIVDTINAWEQYSNIFVTGISASQEARDSLCIIQANGIRIALLSYTSSLNGVTLTNDEKILVNTLYDETVVADEIKYATTVADFVIVLPHWGTDTSKTHSENQEKWAQVFIDNGADLIIGTGSNVLQEVTLYENSEGSIVPCYYSLGNFVSGKTNPDEVLSGAAEITITKTGKVTTLESYDMLPVSLHVSKKGDFFKSYLLEEYPEDTIKWHNLIQNGKDLSLDGMEKQFEDTVDIIDLKDYRPATDNSNITIIQTTKKPSTQTEDSGGEVDTQEDNGGSPLVDDTEDKTTTEEKGSVPSSLGTLQQVGG